MAAESRRRRGWPTWYWWYHFAPRIATAVAQGNCMMVQAWMQHHAQTHSTGRVPTDPLEDDADEGPDALGPGQGRHVRGRVRALMREGQQGAAIALRLREAIEEPMVDRHDAVIEELEGLPARRYA